MFFRIWYYRTSCLITVAFLLPAIILIFISDEYGLGWTTLSDILPLIALLGAPGLLGTISLVWICPFFLAADANLVFNESPKFTLGELRSHVWMPCFVGIPLGTMIAIGLTHLIGIHTTSHLALSNEQITGIILIFLILTTVLPSAWVHRQLTLRMRKLAQRKQTCFECGYDLKGNPNATKCPECGTVVPVGMWEKNGATDHPGQGPAGHDRA